MSRLFTIKNRPRIEIDIVRDHSFYFYNRRENGHDRVFARIITSNRAAEIIEKNTNHVVYQNGTVRFDDGPFRFSWTAEYRQEVDDDSLTDARFQWKATPAA